MSAIDGWQKTSSATIDSARAFLYAASGSCVGSVVFHDFRNQLLDCQKLRTPPRIGNAAASYERRLFFTEADWCVMWNEYAKQIGTSAAALLWLRSADEIDPANASIWRTTRRVYFRVPNMRLVAHRRRRRGSWPIKQSGKSAGRLSRSASLSAAPSLPAFRSAPDRWLAPSSY